MMGAATGVVQGATGSSRGGCCCVEGCCAAVQRGTGWGIKGLPEGCCGANEGGLCWEQMCRVTDCFAGQASAQRVRGRWQQAVAAGSVH